MAADFDLIIIGAGPGGYVTAIRGAQLGMKVAIVERENLGGICLNWGCIPTKALLKSGELYETLGHLDDYGLSVEKRGYDFTKVIEALAQGGRAAEFRRRFPDEEAQDRGHRRRRQAREGAGAPKVVVTLKAGGSRSVQAKHVILATGARARTIPAIGLEPDGVQVWTYREAMVPKVAPKSLIVIGSGAIGIEFASFYRALGSDVTVIEALPRILPVEDEEVSKPRTRRSRSAA
jgi:dihydrolipoamide dehydrogenase